MIFSFLILYDVCSGRSFVVCDGSHTSCSLTHPTNEFADTTERNQILQVIQPIRCVPGTSQATVTPVAGRCSLVSGAKSKIFRQKLSGDLRTRAMVDLQGQRHIAWMKFNEHRGTVRNQHVSLRLRFKFLDSAITPTNLFGFLPCPLASNLLK